MDLATLKKARLVCKEWNKLSTVIYSEKAIMKVKNIHIKLYIVSIEFYKGGYMSISLYSKF